MNRNILITGGTSGIGKGLKDYFESKGDKVFNLSLSSQEYPCDITNAAQLDTVFEKLQNIKFDILINCAGRGLSGAVELTSESDIRAQFELNFFALVSVTKKALPLMKQKAK